MILSISYLITNFKNFNNNTNNIIENLLCGFDINSTDFSGITLLMLASRAGLTLLVEILIKKGASINLQDRYGRTALHHACWSPEYDQNNKKKEILNCIQLLLDNNADARLQTIGGYTALMYFVDYWKITGNSFPIFQKLTIASNLNSKNKYNQTAHDIFNLKKD